MLPARGLLDRTRLDSFLRASRRPRSGSVGGHGGDLTWPCRPARHQEGRGRRRASALRQLVGSDWRRMPGQGEEGVGGKPTGTGDASDL
jgi:hypothetical protein